MTLAAAGQSSDRAIDLLHTEALLDSLYETLEAEIQAIARCDFTEVTRIAVDKEDFLLQLEDAAGTSMAIQSEDKRDRLRNEEKETRAIRRRVSFAAARVRAMMRANSALMGEAIGAISAKLGTDTRSVQSYDKRARTVGQPRRPASKSI